MAKQVRIAAIQMNAQPAPTAERITRAERLVTAAAREGAQLIVLPELFNIGYEYSTENYARAEPLHGETRTWMQRMSRMHSIHLAGSLLIREKNSIFNSLLLFAPDGRFWRYDKLYPWGWERAYFRRGKGIKVANTALGRIGLMICWDAAHMNLWKQYAGQIQCMLISSCPPDVTNAAYELPSGAKLKLDDFGPLFAENKATGKLAFGDMLNEQAAWLGVPMVHTVGSGCINTAIPRSRTIFLGASLTTPKLWPYLSQSQDVRITCQMIPECKIVDAKGNTVAKLPPTPEDAYTVASVMFPSSSPQPQTKQPASHLPQSTYIKSDIVLPGLMRSVYAQGVQKQNQENKLLRLKWLLAFGLLITLLIRAFKRRH